MVIHLLQSSITSSSKTQLVVAFVIKLFSMALSKLFAKSLVMLIFLICVKKHLPKPSV